MLIGNYNLRINVIQAIGIAVISSSWVFDLFSGPFRHHLTDTEHLTCRKYWWMNLLLINNQYSKPMVIIALKPQISASSRSDLGYVHVGDIPLLARILAALHSAFKQMLGVRTDSPSRFRMTLMRPITGKLEWYGYEYCCSKT